MLYKYIHTYICVKKKTTKAKIVMKYAGDASRSENKERIQKGTKWTEKERNGMKRNIKERTE